MVQSIEVFLQPPSPTMNASFKLPSVKSLFPGSTQEDTNSQELPSIRLTNHSSPSDDTYYNENNKFTSSPKLNTIEPRPDLSIATSPYQQSPIMTFSSPSSTTSSIVGSPLISPIQDGPFLLPPPDSSSFRRCRSVSNTSNTSSPSASPSYQFTFRSLSEPPSLNLPPPSTSLEEDSNTGNTEDYHPIFGPKRKRGRPPNASRPEVQSDSNWTFVKPTVWDVKQNHHTNMDSASTSNHQHHDNTFTDSHHTPQFYTENTVMSDGINTFTTTNMDMALSIPKKKRGRKPKKQLAGNSCFVWRDLTAPRGANKKSLLPKKKENKKGQ